MFVNPSFCCFCRGSHASLTSSQLQLQISNITSSIRPASHREPPEKLPKKVMHYAFAPRYGTSPGNISSRSKSSHNDSSRSATITPRNHDRSTLSLNQSNAATQTFPKKENNIDNVASADPAGSPEPKKDTESESTVATDKPKVALSQREKFFGIVDDVATASYKYECHFRQLNSAYMSFSMLHANYFAGRTLLSLR